MSEPPYIPEELVEFKVRQIREQRQLYGSDGISQGDLEEAKRYLEAHPWQVRQWKFFRRITFWWEATLLENFLESIEFLLQKLAFFTILGRLGELAFIVAVVSFVFGENVRRNNEVFAAWITITTAHEQSGSGGRIRALEFLNSRPLRFPWIWVTRDLFGDEKECERKLVFGRRWEREPLAGLSTPKAYLAGINLCGANLSSANFQRADLVDANLQNTRLWGSNFRDAHLNSANLQGAVLNSANLQGAVLNSANLQDVILHSANLQDADLSSANLQDAHLNSANFQDANLNSANLQGAILITTKNLTPKQIKSACFWDRAIYKGRSNLENITSITWIVIEPDNANYIENLKKDTASNPKYPLYCKSLGKLKIGVKRK